MFIEIGIAIFLVFQLRKTLRTFSPDPEWEKRLTIALYVIAVCAILEAAFHVEYITKWIWHLLLLFIIVLAFQKKEFHPSRLTLYAVLPLVLLSLLSSIVQAISPVYYKSLDLYMDYANLVAITWLIALLVRSKKLNKTLLEERKQREEELEEYRLMTERKAELETVVLERTAELMKQKEELQQAITDLKSTQAQLVQREKMASLGELTAGIAHEIQNPLNFVNNFSEVSAELSEELQHEVNKLSIEPEQKSSLNSILSDIKHNQQKINHHGKRADGIVKGMLMHSRKSTGEKELTDINLLADDYMQLSYHGLRAKDKSFNATMQTYYNKDLQKINVVPQDMGRVFLNLFTNAFYAVGEKKKRGVEDYEPVVRVYTSKLNSFIEIRIKDNGDGMSQDILDKIYQPFFTTKPAGHGTGLGLSISYDIIKAHGGELSVNTKEGEFAEFIIKLPIVL